MSPMFLSCSSHRVKCAAKNGLWVRFTWLLDFKICSLRNCRCYKMRRVANSTSTIDQLQASHVSSTIFLMFVRIVDFGMGSVWSDNGADGNLVYWAPYRNRSSNHQPTFSSALYSEATRVTAVKCTVSFNRIHPSRFLPTRIR